MNDTMREYLWFQCDDCGNEVKVVPAGFGSGMPRITCNCGSDMIYRGPEGDDWRTKSDRKQVENDEN